MSNSQFVGRGEILSKKILLKLIECIEIQEQVNIQHLILPEEYEILDQEIKNHNFDFVIRMSHKKDIVVEVNYEHGEKIAKKLRQIIIPLIKKRGYEYLEINDWDCEKRGLFWLNTKREHPVTWHDFRDVINALDTSGIAPDLI